MHVQSKGAARFRGEPETRRGEGHGVNGPNQRHNRLPSACGRRTNQFVEKRTRRPQSPRMHQIFGFRSYKTCISLGSNPIELTDNFVDVSTFSRCDTVRILPSLSLGRSSLHSPGRSWPRPLEQAPKLMWNRDHQDK